MDETRLKALQNRAEMATKAAEWIKELTAASAELSHVKVRLPYHTQASKDLLTEGMMRRVYETGRRQVLKELEEELEGWMPPAQMDALCKWWLEQREWPQKAADFVVLAEIVAERRRQDAKWGGPSHDDGHRPNDWLRFILERIAEGIGKPKPYRQRLLEIAALAVAAIESHDRIDISDLRKEQP